jgi:DNA polymerase-3 subunit gamma/tau
MAAQAGRFGQAGLARAAEIVSTSLDQMRGATSPRLLLELMCAQVLLPAAATDEKSLLTRIERLERGTPAPLPQSPPRPPNSGPNDDAERSGVPASRPPRAPSPPPAASAPPAPAAPAPAPAAPPPAAAPAASGPARTSGPSRAAEPAAAAAAGLSPADSLRQNWAAVLDAVKGERRVAWILLSNASVLSIEDGVLTLRFPRDGDLKGFSTSGCDADLKRVLSSRFGLNVMVKGVVGGDPAAGPAGLAPGFPGTAGTRPGSSDPDTSGSNFSGSGFSGSGFSGSAGRDRGPSAGVPSAGSPVSVAYDDEPPDDEMPPDEDELPDEPPAHRAPAVEPELTGMDLIQRELGGQVIGEIEG